MVLRARWTLAGGPAEGTDEEDEDEESDEDEEEDGVVLLLGPQTLILALPDADDGDERDEVEGEALLPALPRSDLVDVVGRPVTSSICFPFTGEISSTSCLD